MPATMCYGCAVWFYIFLDPVTIDDVVKDYRETSIHETYQRYLQLISEGYQDNYFTLSIAKLARLCVRVELHKVPRLSLRDLRGYTVNRLVNLLPPELLDNRHVLFDEASQHHFYRGDCPAVQPPGILNIYIYIYIFTA